MQRRRSARRALPFIIVLLVAPMLACGWLASKRATIADVVLARDVTPDTLDPVDITAVYSMDQPAFHAVVRLSDAPAGTSVKAVWTALDVGSAAPQETVVGESEKHAQGAQTLHFSVSPDFGNWPPGSYKLDVYLNGELSRTVGFQVVLPTLDHGNAVMRVCPPLPHPILVPSDIVVSVTMALDVQGQDQDPVNPTIVFPPSATFHAVVLIVDAPTDTRVTATWYASDLGELSSCNTKLLVTNVIADDTRNVDFSLTSKMPWPDGEYRVEVSVDDALVEVIPFEVDSAAPTSPSPPNPR